MPSAEMRQMGWRSVHMYGRVYGANTYWLMYSPGAPTSLFMSESVWKDAIGSGNTCAAVDFATGRGVLFEAVKISDDLFHSLRTKSPHRYDLTRWGVAVAFGAVTRGDCLVATLVHLGHQEMAVYDAGETPAAHGVITICDEDHEVPPPLPPRDYDLEESPRAVR